MSIYIKATMYRYTSKEIVLWTRNASESEIQSKNKVTFWIFLGKLLLKSMESRNMENFGIVQLQYIIALMPDCVILAQFRILEEFRIRGICILTDIFDV